MANFTKDGDQTIIQEYPCTTCLGINQKIFGLLINVKYSNFHHDIFRQCSDHCCSYKGVVSSSRLDFQPLWESGYLSSSQLVWGKERGLTKRLVIEPTLHPPSKLLLGCLANTDLSVGLVTRPLRISLHMSPGHSKHCYTILKSFTRV